ncbi:DUF411 domain-containing protein [Bordetella bronchiseptica]|uniref:PF04214 family protein n=2 Tax=Bordetella bronchiseptica TaxID=518 RepID=A0ABR4RI35_BORBO|nr:DUF411 domain-containing protein [Bordetella bronchiseptica]SHP57505.1 Protein of uncharacterised function, DUF [Mycobacteroides abscessus subsp. abscessus]AWP76965.1 metal-binding protein [Bordetella bronchiseptica]AZW23798.1 metal-binding protein [Bordetella bronchiseptica]KCV36817.1 PF04214 family protein [Bordetella bronchiseptica 00-P-2796]KDB98514.1 PF04214 family protein [Bordetella bronchiseptica E010]
MSHLSTLRRALLGALLLAPAAALANTPIPIDVWRTPTCGCCEDWLQHLRSNGFEVRAHMVEDTAPVRSQAGMPARYGSCHTARVQGYTVEGHVPAADIRRLLRDKPRAVGLTAPGMPIGSPGMDGPAYGGRRDAYDVLLVQPDGSARVFQAYR